MLYLVIFWELLLYGSAIYSSLGPEVEQNLPIQEAQSPEDRNKNRF